MKAVVFHDIGDIRLADVDKPKLEQRSDAILRITASAICGTDLHMVRGTLGPMKPGTILGHEAVGIIEDVGPDVRNLSPGDRVVIPSTIGCGYCVYCRSGYFSQCDNSNPHGSSAGTAFFGGTEDSGPFHGLQAEFARIPYANVGPVKLPDEVTDEQAIMVSDIFPTGYFGAKLAEIKPGDVVAVFGCGPVGQFAIASAKLCGAGRVIAVDCEKSRLDMAKAQQAEVIDFNSEDPIEAIKRLTGGIGVDRCIDAVGVDALKPQSGPAAQQAKQHDKEFKQELKEIAPQGLKWHAGDAPSMALMWCVEALCKAGTLSIIGVYPDTARHFPIGSAMNKNLTINMGNCNHRKYIPMLVGLVQSGVIDPMEILTQTEPLTNAIEAYKRFDEHAAGWIKVELAPAWSAS